MEVSLETDEIATADLKNVKFLYSAGGPYFKFNPTAAAAANITQAVSRGMDYFGTCGGALIANLLISVIKSRIKRNWSFSNMTSIIRQYFFVNSIYIY